MARRPRALSPFAALRRNALYKGVLGGSRVWMTVGAFIWGARFARKAFGKTEQIVATEVLKPGQVLRLEVIEPPTRDERSAARRAR